MKSKKIAFGFAFSGVMILCVLAFLEAFLQFNSYLVYLHRYPKADAMFQMVPFLQIQPRMSEELHVNENGFRGDVFDESPDTFTVFTFGGSTTLCASTPYEKTYPALLQKILSEHYPQVKIQVMNAACDWYTTQHSLIRLLFKVRHFHPDLVIMMHGINDMMRSFVPENMSFSGQRFRRDYTHYLGALATYGVDPDQLGVPFRRLLLPKVIKKNLFSFGNFKTSESQRFDVKPVRIEYFKSLPIFEQNIIFFTKVASMLNARALLLTQPNIYSAHLSDSEKKTLYFATHHMMENYKYPDLESLERGMKSFRDAILRTAQETQTPVVDLDAFVPKTGDYFYDDVHPKEITMEMEAKLIAEKIISLGMIDEWKKIRDHVPVDLALK